MGILQSYVREGILARANWNALALDRQVAILERGAWRSLRISISLRVGCPDGKETMRKVTFRKPVGAVVAALAATCLFPNASGQVLNESAKLLSSDGATGDQFGASVSVAGDVLLVGAVRDFHNGSAYVFRCRPGAPGVWVQEQKLLPPDALPFDEFGVSVAVSGDAAVVGARRGAGIANGTGAAYVFRWNGSAWLLEQKLFATDGGLSDWFGYSVSVSGDIAVIGAWGDEDNGSDSGSAYVFRYDPLRAICGLQWCKEQKLLPSDGAQGDVFGASVSISGDAVVVSANGDDDRGSFSGSAYVFRRDPSLTICGRFWCEEQKLRASDGAAYDDFGLSVSLSGDVAVVGAHLDDDNGTNSGSAYVFRRHAGAPGSWVQEQKLLSLDGSPYEEFGRSLSVSGDMAVVGGKFADDNGVDSGSAHVFRWHPGAPGWWVQDQKLLASDGAVGDQLGVCVSVSGDVALVGAYLDDDNGTDSGSAYVFPLSDCNANEVPDECENISGGDFDNNCAVALDDFSAFLDCMEGPNNKPSPSISICAPMCLDAFDLHPDGSIDLRDFANFALVFSTLPFDNGIWRIQPGSARAQSGVPESSMCVELHGIDHCRCKILDIFHIGGL